jgi:hypothetical protein
MPDIGERKRRRPSEGYALPLCRGYDGARPAISISYGFACILYLIRHAARAGCWKIRHDRILLASRQAS